MRYDESDILLHTCPVCKGDLVNYRRRIIEDLESIAMAMERGSENIESSGQMFRTI